MPTSDPRDNDGNSEEEPLPNLSLSFSTPTEAVSWGVTALLVTGKLLIEVAGCGLTALLVTGRLRMEVVGCGILLDTGKLPVEVAGCGLTALLVTGKLPGVIDGIELVITGSVGTDNRSMVD